jgi:hypothetical protein
MRRKLRRCWRRRSSALSTAASAVTASRWRSCAGGGGGKARRRAGSIIAVWTQRRRATSRSAGDTSMVSTATKNRISPASPFMAWEPSVAPSSPALPLCVQAEGRVAGAFPFASWRRCAHRSRVVRSAGYYPSLARYSRRPTKPARPPRAQARSPAGSRPSAAGVLVSRSRVGLSCGRGRKAVVGHIEAPVGLPEVSRKSAVQASSRPAVRSLASRPL